VYKCSRLNKEDKILPTFFPDTIKVLLCYQKNVDIMLLKIYHSVHYAIENISFCA